MKREQKNKKVKKVYRQPKFVNYGLLNELTAGGTAAGKEGTGGGNPKRD